MPGKIIKYILISAFVTATTYAVAQQDTTLTKEVEVVRPYDPTVRDANKINNMPDIDDEAHEKPTFNYSIFSQPIINTFSVNTLKAATFASEPPEDKGFGLVRAGVGNYNKPYGELFFNSQNLKNTLFGLHGKHLSSHGKLMLEGDNRVNAPFSENEAELFVKHMSRNSVLSINLGFNHQGFNYYGYPNDPIPDILLEEDQDINYLGSKQTFTKGSLNINLDNPTAGRNDPAFGFDFLYQYFGTKTGQREHFGEFSTDISKPFNTGTGLLEAGVTFVQADEIFSQTLMQMGKDQQIWLAAKPGYLLGGDIANIRVGFNGWFVLDDDSDAIAKLAPNVRVNFAPVKEIINLFAGVDGNYQNNHYSRMASENPFIDPLHDVRNSFEKFHFYGGFDGKLAKNTNFKISADYSMIQDKPLYYLFKYAYSSEGPSIVDNDFNVIYDNLDLLKFNLEIFHAAYDKMNLLISGNYYVYKMETLEQAWNLPDWDAKLAFEYHISEQLSVSTDLFLIGERKSLILEVPYEDPRPLTSGELLQLENLQMNSGNMDPVFDLNFSANYRITEQFSLFARLNNFGFQKYQRWLGYPVQSFNALIGLSYAF